MRGRGGEDRSFAGSKTCVACSHWIDALAIGPACEKNRAGCNRKIVMKPASVKRDVSFDQFCM